MTDRPGHRDEPRRLDPEPVAPEPPAAGPAAGRPDAADPDAAASTPAAGSDHYRDLAIARRLRAARASVGAVVRPAAPVAPGTVPATGLAGGDDRAGSRADAVTTAHGSVSWWARRGPRWAAPEVRIAAVVLVPLLAGVVAAALPEGAAGTRPPLPDHSPPDPGIQVPVGTIEGPATTAQGQGTTPVGGPVGGGQLRRPPGSTGSFGGQPGGTPVRSPTSWAPWPSRTAPPTVTPPHSTTSPPTTIPPQTTTSAVPTTAPEPTGSTEGPPPTS
jgi:hypothetical protein